MAFIAGKGRGTSFFQKTQPLEDLSGNNDEHGNRKKEFPPQKMSMTLTKRHRAKMEVRTDIHFTTGSNYTPDRRPIGKFEGHSPLKYLL